MASTLITRVTFFGSATGENTWMDGTNLARMLPLPGSRLTWSIGGTGDFNADDKTDILWRNSAG